MTSPQIIMSLKRKWTAASNHQEIGQFHSVLKGISGMSAGNLTSTSKSTQASRSMAENHHSHRVNNHTAYQSISKSKSGPLDNMPRLKNFLDDETAQPLHKRPDSRPEDRSDHLRTLLQASPFYLSAPRSSPNATLGQDVQSALEQLRLKAETRSDVAAIYNLACELWRSDRFPSQLRDLKTVERAISSPDLLPDIINELCLGTACPAPRPAKRGPVILLDNIRRKTRVILACAMEATRNWRYNTPLERIVMFWSCSR